MTSVAAVLGFSRDQRAYLGGWSMGMVASEEYVRMSRQVVTLIQKTVNEAIVSGHLVFIARTKSLRHFAMKLHLVVPTLREFASGMRS